MKYSGTSIDGVALQPEGLFVRGMNLNAIVAEKGYIDTVFHLFNSRFPQDSEHHILEDFFIRSLNSVSFTHPALEQVSLISTMTDNPLNSVMSALLFDFDKEFLSLSEHPVHTLFSDRDTVKGLFIVALLPVVIGAATNRMYSNEPEAGVNYPMLAFRNIFSRKESSQSEVAIFEKLLIAWHAGFGFLTPSILAPRVAAGTRARSNMIILAGFAASGPFHIGASQLALQWINELLQENDAEIENAIKTLINKKETIPGFGHPLFKEDPRPSVLRDIWQHQLGRTRCMEMYDLVCDTLTKTKQLKPNIDFITAAILADFGCTDAFVAPASGLYARSIAMIAHAEEKRTKPAFGNKSADARDYLMNKEASEFLLG